MRYLVTGGSGLLGRRLVQRLGQAAEVVGTFCSAPVAGLPLVPLNVTEPSQVNALIDLGAFDVCIHTAANRNLEACESNVGRVMRLNVEGTRFVAEACRRAGTRMVYISTDHVFDGAPEVAYTEDDDPRPIQVYGFTKLAGEYQAQRTGGALCIRVPVLHGVSQPDQQETFPTQALRRLRAGHTVPADDHLIRYPVLLDDLVDAVAEFIAQDVEGIVHFSSDRGVTKFAWARLIAETFGLDSSLVRARPEGGRAARPRDNRLRSNRLAGLGIRPPTSIADATVSLQQSAARI